MQEGSCNLAECFLCNTCIPEWKPAIAARKKTYRIKKGGTVFKEGEEVKGIFFMVEGAVKVHKQWTEEKELILRFAKGGDILGHRGLGGFDRYPISATALENTKVCFIPNDFLEATLKTNADFTYQMLHFYATELQRAEKRMRDLAHMEVKGRIADALFQMQNVFGFNKENFISTTITRQDIASYAGTTYETVFKFFNELSAAGIIATSGKNIRIEKPVLLRNFIANEN
jgi:CRP-like cAMP-binding protein